MGIAGALVIWLTVGSGSEPEPMFCGVGSEPDVSEEVRKRWAASDSARLAPWRERLAIEPDLENGKNVFRANCAACHKPDKDVSGPALQGILDRAPEPALNWYIAFMSNEYSLVKAGDPYTLALRERWRNIPWFHPNELSTKDLLDVLVWVELYKAGPVR